MSKKPFYTEQIYRPGAGVIYEEPFFGDDWEQIPDEELPKKKCKKIYTQIYTPATGKTPLEEWKNNFETFEENPDEEIPFYDIEEESEEEDEYDEDGKIFHEAHYDEAEDGDRILMASQYQIPGKPYQWYRKGIIGLDPHLIEKDYKKLEERKKKEKLLEGIPEKQDKEIQVKPEHQKMTWNERKEYLIKQINYGIENETDEDFKDLLLKMKPMAENIEPSPQHLDSEHIYNPITKRIEYLRPPTPPQEMPNGQIPKTMNSVSFFDTKEFKELSKKKPMRMPPRTNSICISKDPLTIAEKLERPSSRAIPNPKFSKKEIDEKIEKSEKKFLEMTKEEREANIEKGKKKMEKIKEQIVKLENHTEEEIPKKETEEEDPIKEITDEHYLG
jgi:hypothetical protein